MPVVKSDGSIRICGDYKVTVNAVAKLETYPLPKVADSFAALSGGVLFSKLDLSNAYQPGWQIRVRKCAKTHHKRV